MIVVTTPTGNIGQNVLSGLLQSGEAVRVVVRDASRLAAEAQDSVEVVEGALDDVRVLRQAFAGAEAAFVCAPHSNTIADVQAHYQRFAQPVCEAIRLEGVRRVVAVSSGGRGRASNAGPISALHAMEALIEATGANFRALRSGHLMENLLWQVAPIKHAGAFFFPLAGDLKLPSCATRDVSTSAVRELCDRSWSGQSGIGVHGPEDLSYNDMALIMSEVLRQPVRFQEVPGASFKASLMDSGSSEAFAQGLVDMFAVFGKGLYEAEPRTPETTTPTTFRQWCEEVLRPAVALS